MRVSKQADRGVDLAARPARCWWFVVVSGLVGGCLGALLMAWSSSPNTLVGLQALVTSPALALRAAQMRSTLPRLQLDVGFSDYQRLVNAAAEGLGAEPVCVPAAVAGDSASVAARVCSEEARFVDGNYQTPALSLSVEDGGTLLGMRRASLVPATPDAALVQGYFQALETAGLPVPEFRVVGMSVNGSDWGLYAVEELVSFNGLPGSAGGDYDLVAAFEAPARIEGLPAAPGSSFAAAELRIGSAVDEAPGDWESAAQRDPELAAMGAAAADRVEGLLSGALLSSEVLDTSLYSKYLALTCLWRGVLMPDWQVFRLAYSSDSGRFVPLAAAARHSGQTPLAVQFYDDPELQRAYVQALSAYSDSDYVDASLEDSDLAATYLMLGGTARGSGAIQDVLSTNRAVMRAFITPSSSVRVSVLDDDGYLQLAFEATEPYPIEVQALELGEQGVVTLKHEWILEPSGDAALVESPGIVLRARTGAEPVVLRMRIPLDALPPAASRPGLELSVITCVWGLDGRIPVRAATSGIGRGVRGGY